MKVRKHKSQNEFSHCLSVTYETKETRRSQQQEWDRMLPQKPLGISSNNSNSIGPERRKINKTSNDGSEYEMSEYDKSKFSEKRQIDHRETVCVCVAYILVSRAEVTCAIALHSHGTQSLAHSLPRILWNGRRRRIVVLQWANECDGERMKRLQS